MVFLFVAVAFFYAAISTKRFPSLWAFGIDITKRLHAFIEGITAQSFIADKFLWLLGGIMVVIFSANIFGLILDAFVVVSYHEFLAAYIRPVFADISSTLVLALTVILIAQYLGLRYKGVKHQLSHYFFHYHGSNTTEKIVNVFVGWLHFIGEFIRIGSLSMRLFLNILVGMILISVAVYIGKLIPSFDTGVFQILSLPFWIFEILIAFLQAYIFMVLSSLYLRESYPESH